MLKAKAKAKATAAKQKKLAAERAATAAAAAAAAAAAQHAQAAQAIPNPVVGSRSGPGGRPSVTQYWVDNQSSMLSSGGGIQRIGYGHGNTHAGDLFRKLMLPFMSCYCRYDQAAFEDGVRNVILDPEPASFDKTAAAGEGGEGEKKSEATTTTTEGTTEEKKVDGGAREKSEVQVDEELVAVLTKEFDLTPEVATALLQTHQNDLSLTIEALLTPPSHHSAPSGRPASKLVSVSN
ncbi:BZ3500_MvSof-1268-A1-R1_Chr4-4g07542 [Microbotryum saponariae]|uniref:BZ3500_MvSof-1268-A1-R1_Chr4-4g07542 protein n=1 Tax=Microbotryum saponariae TaxID=289078 RepID=A0A2X0KXP3_9BASI|nr:BZ3500_MvSof-1268-A1-R1_Chr4-4g07542 [Microbotryum saponariae]SDA07203.1 BZ3501_MvSof-1269-A2-R1_Chr4-3g07250 [Microbotryum saponariae]